MSNKLSKWYATPSIVHKDKIALVLLHDNHGQIQRDQNGVSFRSSGSELSKKAICNNNRANRYIYLISFVESVDVGMNSSEIVSFYYRVKEESKLPFSICFYTLCQMHWNQQRLEVGRLSDVNNFICSLLSAFVLRGKRCYKNLSITISWSSSLNRSLVIKEDSVQPQPEVMVELLLQCNDPCSATRTRRNTEQQSFLLSMRV